MDEQIRGFEWDEGNREKCRKHGVTSAQVEGVFSAELSIYPDSVHSDTETRFLAIGPTIGGRHVFVAFTIRLRDGVRFIRPISARFMHRKEIAHYEKAHT